MNLKAIPLAAYFVLFPHFQPAWADCGASLVTGIDASASTGADGLAMQLDGISEALQSPGVISAMQSQGCVRIAVFAWSDGPAVILLPWTEISSAEDAENVTAILRNADTGGAPKGVLTNVSQALDFAYMMLGQIPPTGRQVVNIVSDGEDNVSESPEIASARLRAAGVTINAVLFGPSATLEAYYRTRVTGGRGSFVLRVNGAGDFAATYTAKFRLDLAQVNQ